MERKVVDCPKCEAVCCIGHDDDGQVCCAKCGHTFLPKTIKELDDNEYKQLEEKVTQMHIRGGWIAFTVD